MVRIKNLHASFHQGPGARRRWRPRGLRKRQLSAHQRTPGRAVCRAGGLGPVGPQAGGVALRQPRGHRGPPHPHGAPGDRAQLHSPRAGGKQREVCLVLGTRWLSFRKEFPRVHSIRSFPVTPEAAPPNYTCLLQAALLQGL